MQIEEHGDRQKIPNLPTCLSCPPACSSACLPCLPTCQPVVCLPAVLLPFMLALPAYLPALSALPACPPASYQSSPATFACVHARLPAAVPACPGCLLASLSSACQLSSSPAITACVHVCHACLLASVVSLASMSACQRSVLPSHLCLRACMPGAQ